ncbi:hypothetical protein CFP56_028947 [Quercus suber]|uniref:Uncharacterized protein n=1 Tax=Quercus suber TaxID=58331 RepID=A0AAW0JRN9_QUESU
MIGDWANFYPSVQKQKNYIMKLKLKRMMLEMHFMKESNQDIQVTMTVGRGLKFNVFPVGRWGTRGGNAQTDRKQVFSIYEERIMRMSVYEIKAAIHTDSRHASQLRSVYSSRETAECGYVVFKWIDFVGSCKILLVLNHVSGDYESNVYELLSRA